jgi:hypothetical protein
MYNKSYLKLYQFFLVTEPAFSPISGFSMDRWVSPTSSRHKWISNTLVNTRGLLCSFDRRNSTPLFLTRTRPKPAATPPIYPPSCPDLLLSTVECQSWDQLPSLLPCGSASGAVTQTELEKTRDAAFCAGGGGTGLLRVPLAFRSPRRRQDADDHSYPSRRETCRSWRHATMS